ncbi:LTA synthase family protein [Paenibacillus crassostreae]|uniref:Sulfatase n=1 Tax=Paenibacillus crassostreae TaxID=1763538 RepID=A0A162RK45_9BACL|nr:LTA synthase family protein [Paenibacillus crassostreae]AOZ94653.1 sulfatase [Paenibacillus crassostreae]OAB72557.1 sulfatase [Paenibacillus crassostreae]
MLLFVAKLSLLRFFYFREITGSGLLADTLSILILVSLLDLILPSKAKRIVFWILNTLFSVVLFAATLYQVHFGSVPTYTTLSGLGQVGQIRASIQSLIKPIHFLFFTDLAIALILTFMGFIRPRRAVYVHRVSPIFSSTFDHKRKRLKWKMVTALLLVISISGSSLLINRSLGIHNELVQANKLGFLNYQVAAILKLKQEDESITKGNLQQTIADVRTLQSTYPYIDDPSVAPASFGSAKGMNVIVIQMEAFQNFPIHLRLGQQEVTPVLNKLAQESYYFPYFYQQIGQGNTSDAEFISNTSIYPTGTDAMSSGFGNRQIPSLPRLLGGLQYTSATFHINDVTFWSRNLLYPALGFDHYYDKPFYKNDHFNDFGASDEEMYRVGVEKMKELSADNHPFYTQFVTTSSHAPFVIPEDRRQLTLPSDMEGTELGHYLTAVNYTDYAIGKLIDQLKENGLWDNTVLVAYGDHFGINPKEIDGAEITDKLGVPYHNQISRFNIPLLIHVPNQGAGKVVELTGGQLDIMPTVANLMGISLEEENFTTFGRDLLNTDHNVFGMRYYSPTGTFFNNDIMFVPGAGFEDGNALSLKTLQPVEDISAYRSDYDYIMSLMQLSDHYMQLLPKRAP